MLKKSLDFKFPFIRVFFSFQQSFWYFFLIMMQKHCYAVSVYWLHICVDPKSEKEKFIFWMKAGRFRGNNKSDVNHMQFNVRVDFGFCLFFHLSFWMIQAPPIKLHGVHLHIISFLNETFLFSCWYFISNCKWYVSIQTNSAAFLGSSGLSTEQIGNKSSIYWNEKSTPIFLSHRH